MDENSIESLVIAAKAVQDDASSLELWLPLEEGMPARGQLVLPRSLVKGTRSYIERVVEQINSTYENTAYDACAVMIRRLVETLLIESFEHHGIATKIQDPMTGYYFMLSGIVPVAIAERAKWHLGRNSEQALKQLKELGDKSAHNRRFNAVRNDIDRVRDGLRTVTQELLVIAGLK